MSVPDVRQKPVPARDGSQKPSQPRRPTPKDKQDDMIMNTNNSCIVSKRSVEKLYHKDDAGFLRHFVSKFQRRSPLINRGYWLRMQAVEHVVRTFLTSTTIKPKAVVNLGCGYDTLPFKFIAKHQDICANALFIDVDYKQLIQKKCKVIQTTPALSQHIPGASYTTTDDSCIHLSSSQYIAVSCDLQNRNQLQELQRAARLDDFDVLFLAEVSMTYMDAQAAESMLAWASAIPGATFGLLEQYLPDGPDSAFGRTMLKHFEKLQSPLKSAVHYPSLSDQCRRFTTQGWRDVRARSMWELWNTDSFLSPEARRELDYVEPFDEWEEFIMFASHYFVLVALQSSSQAESFASLTSNSSDRQPGASYRQVPAFFDVNPKGRGQRRYGASVSTPGQVLIHHGGHGTKGRLQDADVYSRTEDHASILTSSLPKTEVMCHTITQLTSGAYLMVGGRTSPGRSTQACYFWQQHKGWTNAGDLPQGRYRHCTVALGNGVLLMGGKHDSTTFAEDWLYWAPERGWRTVELQGNGVPSRRFGACATSTCQRGSAQTEPGPFEAILCGGMGCTGQVLSDAWGLSGVRESEAGKLHVDCTAIEAHGVDGLARHGRFGARLVDTPSGMFLVGGCPASGTERGAEVLHVDSAFHATPISLCAPPSSAAYPRPMLTGHTVEVIDGLATLVMIGGGAVCFSFGTVWNEGVYSLRLGDDHRDVPAVPQLKLLQPMSRAREPITKRTSRGVENHEALRRGAHYEARPALAVRKIPWLDGPEHFRRILQERQPVVLQNLDLGECRGKWTLDYLKATVGAERTVTVHDAQTPAMNFLDKNFEYKKKTFGELVDSIAEGGLEYMRAVSGTQPGRQATMLEDDFPELAKDFSLPIGLAFVRENMHSSPLRVSGPVKMWLHYDVMSNVLCQIRGHKKVMLYAPRDADRLDLPAGASSSRLDALDASVRNGSALRDAQAHEADLNEGDVLFIPALWAHAAAPVEGMSIAVNVFFRDLQKGYSAGRDVYGNRDLAAYESGRKEVARIVDAFADLPGDAGEFYLRRLADEVREAAEACGKRSVCGES